MRREITDEAIEARRIYQNEWRKKNKDKVRDYNARYWQRKAEELKRQRESEDA